VISVQPGHSFRWWVLNVATPIIVITVLTLMVWVRREQLQPLAENPGRELLLIGVLLILAHFLNSTEYWVLYKAQGANISMVENWMLFTAGNLGNLLPGQAGTFYKFKYMRDVRNMPYSMSATNYGANLVLTFGSSAFIGLVGVFVTAYGPNNLSYIMLFTFSSLALAFIFMLVWPVPEIRWLRGRAAKGWNDLREGWEGLRKQPLVTTQVVLLDIGKYLLSAWRFQIAFSLLGLNESFFFFLAIVPAAAIATIIAVTPAALGFREAFITTAAVAMGTNFSTGLLVSAIDRGILLIVFLTMGTVGFLYTWPRLTQANSNAGP
jgi:uncharacterized membrane protein YbhN (UPF0104 family)